MASDSSEDEDLEKFREATDSQFINDSMFTKSDVQKVDQPQTEKLPSLRRCKDEDEQFNLFRVTPEFRNHVAKHLSTLLDKKLEKLLTETNYDSYIKPKKRKSRVRLLHNSSHYIKETSESAPKIIPRKTIDDDNNEEKFKTVAVTPEDILSQKDTKAWSTRSKAPVYTYIKTKTGLVLK